MRYQLIVSSKDQSESADLFEVGHEWSVEGDYGFLGSFNTQKEAWGFAEKEISGAYNGGTKLDAEVVLNA